MFLGFLFFKPNFISMKNVFNLEDSNKLIARINQLNPNTQGLWGVMTVAQMLAHCNVTYEMIYDTIHPKPNFIKRILLQSFVKKHVVNEKPYPKNTPTASQFRIKEEKNFEIEKDRLIQYIVKTHALGTSFFNQKESLSFGKLATTEWNNMLYKHLDHHLQQFGV